MNQILQKKPKKSPTPRQKKAAKAVILNELSDNPKPLNQVLGDVSYGKISNQPSRILQSEGFQNALTETGLLDALKKQGINPTKIAKKIDELLENEEYQAIDKGLKHATAIYGITEKQTSETKNTYNFIFSPEVQTKVHQMNEDIKKLLIQSHDKKD